jgi:hypothetical protein
MIAQSSLPQIRAIASSRSAVAIAAIISHTQWFLIFLVQDWLKFRCRDISALILIVLDRLDGFASGLLLCH